MIAGLAGVLPAEAQTRLRVQTGQPAAQPQTTGTPFPAGVRAPRGSGVTLFPNQFQPGLPPTQGTPFPQRFQSPGQIGGGVRSAFPEPIRPGQGRLRLPPTPPPPPQPPPGGQPPIIIIPPRPPVWIIDGGGGSWYGPGYRDRYPQQIITQPVIYQQSPLAPAATAPEAEPPAPPTAREIGDGALYWGEPEQAISAYQEHLAEHDEDHAALRMLGLALIDAGRIDEGVAAIGLAYERDPQLASAFVPGDLYGSGEELRRNLNRVSMHANKVNNASAWLTLAVMMQIEGRPLHASRMLDRAERAGLEAEVLEPMRAALSRR